MIFSKTEILRQQAEFMDYVKKNFAHNYRGPFRIWLLDVTIMVSLSTFISNEVLIVLHNIVYGLKAEDLSFLVKLTLS